MTTRTLAELSEEQTTAEIIAGLRRSEEALRKANDKLQRTFARNRAAWEGK